MIKNVIIFTFFLVLKNKTAGKVNSVIISKLKANNPMTLKIWITSVAQEKLYAHKFQGKPVNIFDLTKSEKAKAPEKIKIECKFKFKYEATTKIVTLKNKLKNNGIIINAIGIKMVDWIGDKILN